LADLIPIQRGTLSPLDGRLQGKPLQAEDRIVIHSVYSCRMAGDVVKLRGARVRLAGTDIRAKDRESLLVARSAYMDSLGICASALVGLNWYLHVLFSTASPGKLTDTYNT
jgi:hypothetical protein